MNFKSTYIIGAIVVILVSVTLAFLWIKLTGNEMQMDETESIKSSKNSSLISVAPEVEKILMKNMALIGELVNDRVIINEVRSVNETNKELTFDEISKLDRQWRDSEENGFITPFLINKTARKLLEFQEMHPGFSEIFVTDENGLNVGQTNKTTDYYQADEDWWTGAYNNGEGDSYYGPIEFDESAQAEAISIYVPVRDPDSGRVIGVVKAVLSIAAIKIEL